MVSLVRSYLFIFLFSCSTIESSFEKIIYKISLDKKIYKKNEAIKVSSYLINNSSQKVIIALKPESHILFRENHMPVFFGIVKIKLRNSYKNIEPNGVLESISILGKAGYISYRPLGIGKYYFYSIYGFEGQYKSNTVKFEIVK